MLGEPCSHCSLSYARINIQWIWPAKHQSVSASLDSPYYCPEAWWVGPRLCPDPTKATHWITLVVIQTVDRTWSTMAIIGINGWSVRNSLRALNEKETDISYTSRRLFREVWHFCRDFRWVDLISKTISSYGGALRGRATRVQQLLQKGRGKAVGAAISTSSWCWLPWIAAARFGRNWL